jgi:hypothetical protein
MHTWLGAFDDSFASLETEDGPCPKALKLEELRAKLRVWTRRGWRRMEHEFKLINDIGCREDLPPPLSRGDQRVDQQLPDDECGQPTACRLQAFIQARKLQAEAIAAELETLPSSCKDKETVARIEGLRHLLSMSSGTPFDGRQCHRCGDALICLEVPDGCIIVTKNRKHFEPLAQILGKALTIVDTARSTTHGTPPFLEETNNAG